MAGFQFAAFVITYNRPGELSQSLTALMAQSCAPDLILVVDNGDLPEARAVVCGFEQERLIYTAMPENVGPAGGIAHALKWFESQPYEWIYCGDDDDPPGFPDDLERLLKLAENAPPDVAAVGAFGSKFHWGTGELIRLRDDYLRGTVEVDCLPGNSQLLLRRSVIQSVGVPDERLFFGYDDLDYCLRVRRAGYRLLVDGDLMRNYRARAGRFNLGQRPRAVVPQHAAHGIWRQYYSTRNYIYMMRKTFGLPRLARRETVKAVARMLASWVRGPRYGATFSRLQLMGIVDGYTGRMGRTLNPGGNQVIRPVDDSRSRA